jgi:heat shock protein HslJ
MSAVRRIYVQALGCALLACALVGACSGDESSGSGSTDLAGKVFVSTGVEGSGLAEITSIRMTFEDGSVSAIAGCNTIFGGATWDDGTLTVDGELARTTMGCDDALSAQDDWLSEFLSSGPSVELDGSTLTLDDGVATITLEQE